ncbi:MAG: ROK family transcriptional regulator [bacterium]|nr:ROK family transcriptional regulator [bacterium]
MRRIDLKKVSVARSNTIRDINRQIVLNYVREKGPISRADIAKETDLQRSTVSHIVKELTDFNLIKEVFGESSGGRPPALLTLRSARPVAIGVDLGTVKTIVGCCDLTGRIIDNVEFFTDRDESRTTELIIRAVQSLMKKYEGMIEGIGVSLPALVDSENEHILFSPHFTWRDPLIAERIHKSTSLPVMVENDANAAALAELWFGRLEVRDVRDFILVFIENGIGTGIVFDGQIYRGPNGVAGEFGHMRIGTDAPTECATGSRECWEAFASERSALSRFEKLSGRSVEEMTFGDLVELSQSGDENAIAALKETARFIGLGLGNLIQGLSPEAIVVGGTIVNVWPLIADEIQAAADSVICQGIHQTMILPSSLGSQPGLFGAFSLVLADKFASISF